MESKCSRCSEVWYGNIHACPDAWCIVNVESAHAEALLQAERRKFACPVCGTSFRLTGGGVCALHVR
jgi:hypothetical protein